MTLGKRITAQEGFLHHKVAPRPQKWPESTAKTPKIIPKISSFALSGHSTGVTLVINHSIFLKRAEVKLLGLKRGLYTQKHPQNRTFRPVRGSDSCYIVKQPLCFYYMTLSKVIRAQEVDFRPKKEHLDHKSGLNQPKKRPAKTSLKIARSALSEPTTLFSLNDPK